MRPIGFSTGALGYGDTRLALSKLEGVCVNAIELSALRAHELTPLIDFVADLDLSRFDYVSVHAPAKFIREDECAIVARLSALSERGWPIVLHPDAIHDYGCWRELGAAVLVENMDKRKPIGRTVEELREVLIELPSAGLCFDFAHARQFDSSMTQAYLILTAFRDLIKQIHLSEVPSSSRHDRISQTAAESYRDLAKLLPPRVPVILETPVGREEIQTEIAIALFALGEESSEAKSELTGFQ